MTTVKNLLALGMVAGLSLTMAGCPKSSLRTDWFTQVFVGGNDLDGLQLNFEPNDGPNGYTQTNSVVSEFPVDPAGGVILDFDTMGDPVMAGTADGQMVPYYGELYDTLYIASQGWVSFGEEGNTPTTLGEHFATTQISALPLDATAAGSMVSYLQTDDGLAITYENVPGANKDLVTILNNIQIFIDWFGYIRISYIDVDPSIFGIVGLSFGIPVYENEFVPSFLSNTPFAKTAI